MNDNFKTGFEKVAFLNKAKKIVGKVTGYTDLKKGSKYREKAEHFGRESQKNHQKAHDSYQKGKISTDDLDEASKNFEGKYNEFATLHQNADKKLSRGMKKALITGAATGLAGAGTYQALKKKPEQEKTAFLDKTRKLVGKVTGYTDIKRSAKNLKNVNKRYKTENRMMRAEKTVKAKDRQGLEDAISSSVKGTQTIYDQSAKQRTRGLLKALATGGTAAGLTTATLANSKGSKKGLEKAAFLNKTRRVIGKITGYSDLTRGAKNLRKAKGHNEAGKAYAKVMGDAKDWKGQVQYQDKAGNHYNVAEQLKQTGTKQTKRGKKKVALWGAGGLTAAGGAGFHAGKNHEKKRYV